MGNLLAAISSLEKDNIDGERKGFQLKVPAAVRVINEGWRKGKRMEE